ncbi:MAG TPA: VacJ family lipoprotein [Nevskiaceae bacterium]|nr:VacJ family lipoprotein [Nevskiaceae bacterium]
MQAFLRGTAAALALTLCGCAHTPADDPADPLESMNRAVFAFNMKADQYVARPVAKGYVKVVPDFARTGINNFFNNLKYPTVIINDALQAKFLQGGEDLCRFVVNSTVGVAGLLDPGTRIGLERHDEDFGQTLGKWGLGQGWYLMLPLLGPSSNRDLVGRAGDYATSVTTWVNTSTGETIAIDGVDIIDTRAQLLSADSILDQQFDKYIFVRTAYLQHRQALVYDGHPPKEDYDIGE